MLQRSLLYVWSLSQRLPPICSIVTTQRILPSYKAVLSARNLRTTAKFSVDRDYESKAHVIKSSTEGREEFIDSSTVDVAGLTEAGVVIPTLETHASLIDGIRYDELPIVHIHSSLNNTIMTVTDHTGTKIIARNSCGIEGFKNVKKSTAVAAQATGHTIGATVLKKGIRNIRAVVKGLGVGRLASLKGLQAAGMNVISISDRTHVPHDAPRPRKPRRI